MRSERIRTALDGVNPTQEQKARMRQALARELGVSPAREERKAAPKAPTEKREKVKAEPTPTVAKRSRKNHTARKKRSGAAIWLSAAATVAVILGAGFLIRLSLAGTGAQEAAPLATGAETEAPTVPTVTLDDLAARPEYQAQREWLDFRSTAGAGEDSSGLSTAYQRYGCNSQADCDKLDEIISAYGLTMGIWENSDSLTMQEQADAQLAADKIGNLSSLVPEGSPVGVTRSRDTSSSDFSGDACIVGTVESSSIWEYPVSYLLYFNAENSFSPFFPMLGSTEDYESWSYTTSSGAAVAIGLGQDSAVIYCPAENGFYLACTENIRVGDVQTGEHTMTREQVEAFADTFYFPQAVTEDRIAAGEARYEEALSRWKAAAQGQDTTCAEASSTAMSLGQEDYGYTFRDLDGDGTDELLITDGRKLYGLHSAGSSEPVLVDSSEYLAALLEKNPNIPDATAISVQGTPCCYVTLNNHIVLNCYPEAAPITRYCFYALKDGALELVEVLASAENGYEQYNADGSSTWIAAEQYDDIVASYPLDDLSFKPLAQYLGQEETQADSSASSTAEERMYAETLGQWISWSELYGTQTSVTGEERPYSADKIGYLFRDLDSDGKSEMLITNGASVYAVYGPGNQLLLDEDMMTEALWVCDDNTLCVLRRDTEGDHSILEAGQYMIQNGGCLVISEVERREDGNVRRSASGSETAISDAEYVRAVSEIRFRSRSDLSYKPLSQWPGYLGLLADDSQRAAYRTVLEKYRSAIQEGWSLEQCDQAEISLLTANAADTSEIGYQCRDLDDDGTLELIVTNGNVIYGLYTLSGGQAQEVFRSWDRRAYYLCTDNSIASEGSNSAAIFVYEFSRLEGSRLVTELSLMENHELDAESPWFRGSTGTDEKTEPLSQEEFNAELAQHIHASLHFTPLSQME